MAHLERKVVLANLLKLKIKASKSTAKPERVDTWTAKELPLTNQNQFREASAQIRIDVRKKLIEDTYCLYLLLHCDNFLHWTKLLSLQAEVSVMQSSTLAILVWVRDLCSLPGNTSYNASKCNSQISDSGVLKVQWKNERNGNRRLK